MFPACAQIFPLGHQRHNMSYAHEVRAEILRLTREIDTRYRRLGALLKEMRDKELWRALGFASFEEFVRVELGFRERKARYLIETAEGFERAGITEEEAATVQSSKAAIIAPVLTAASKDQWLELARTMPARDLARAVAKAQGRAVSDEAMHVLSFGLFTEQEATVQQALALAGQAGGTDSRGAQLVIVCQEFIGAYSHLAAEAPAAPAETVA